jgi:transcriptional regulator with XRE-family HTH domain
MNNSAEGKNKIRIPKAEGKREFDARLNQLLEDAEFRAEWEAEKPKRELAQQVLRRRSELDLSQRDLAGLMGTSQSQIHKIESGAANPRLETLQSLSEALKVPLEELLGGAHTEGDKETDATVSESMLATYEEFGELFQDEIHQFVGQVEQLQKEFRLQVENSQLQKEDVTSSLTSSWKDLLDINLSFQKASLKTMTEAVTNAAALQSLLFLTTSTRQKFPERRAQ